MPWRLGIVAALLAWLVLAGPADAAIQRSTDSRGVIRISNVPAKPAPSPPDNRAEAPEPKAMVSLPEPAPPVPPGKRSPETEAVNLQAAKKATEQVCRDLAHGGFALQPQAIDQIIASAALAAATVETAEDAPQRPLKMVAHEPDAAEAEADPATIPAPAAFIREKGKIITAGGIRRYQDARGVWHITNVSPDDAETGAPVLLAENRLGQGKAASPERPLSPPAAAQSGLPLQKVSWSPDNPALEAVPTKVAAARTAAPGMPAPIRRYRDSKGVIHIDNVGPEAVESPAPAKVQARAGPREEPGPSRKRPPPPVEAVGPLAVKPAAWSDEGGLPLRPLKTSASRTAAITTEGGIRRWRDKKGVWRIETVEYPLPEGVRLPPRRSGPLGSQIADASLPSTAPGPPAGIIQATPATYAPLGAQVTAFRDRQGRLKITSEAPGRSPPLGAAPAPAELEPFIADAARVHRLPPTLVRAVIKVESDFCSWAVSPKGAMGLMQLMPGTASFLGVQEPFDPRQNILGGCRYLRLLIDCFGGDLHLALAAYNAGYQRVINSGYRVPAIKETQDFVTQVMGRYVAEEKRQGQPWT